jgi:predicted phage terminase large subunit-like protein
MPDGADIRPVLLKPSPALRPLLFEFARRRERRECEGSLLAFLARAWREFDPSPFIFNWHHKVLCEELEALARGEIRDSVINIPPRTGKTNIISVAFPAWLWVQPEERQAPLMGPHVRFLCVSYGSTLAEVAAVKMRRLVMGPWYQAHWGKRVQIRADQAGRSDFGNTAGGERISNSIEGGILGRGGDIQIIDDPHKVDGAESDVERDRTLRALAEGLTTRITDPRIAARVLVMQRLHSDDATNHALERWPDPSHVMLPMRFDPERATEADPRNEPGELLWPEVWDEESVLREERELGSYGAAGQLQQMPVPRGGGIILEEWWQFWPDGDFPPFGTCVAALDTAYKLKEESDYNALTVWSAFAHPETDKPKVMLRDAWQVRATLADLVAKVIKTCLLHKVDTLLIEDSARGSDVADEIHRLVSKREIHIELVPPAGDKASRLSAVSPLFENEIIYAPDREWSQMVIDQVAKFPRVRHDDLCFVAGTAIATRRGAVPIEEVVAGDFVVTPLGWRRVTAQSATGVKAVVSRGALCGTAGHPVYTFDAGYRHLYSINSVSLLSELTLCGLMRQILPRRWNSWVLSTAAWEGSGGIISRNPRLMRGVGKPKVCTLPSGSTKSGARPLLVMRCITGTTIRLIVILTTWSVYRKACIAANLRTWTRLRSERIWSVFGRWLLCGTALTKGASGIEGMQKIVSGKKGRPSLIRWLCQLSCCAIGAETNTAQYSRGYQGFVVSDALRHVWLLSVERIRKLVGITLPLEEFALTAPANGAALFSLPPISQNHGREGFASSHARLHSSGTNTALQKPSTLTMQPVYNLKVEDAGCYYANGVLVHNCDTVALALSYLRKTGVVVRREEHDDEVTERLRYRKQPTAVYDV